MNNTVNQSTTEWQVAVLRLTAFPSPSEEIHAQNWWINTLGNSPDTITNTPKAGLEHLEGAYEGGKIILEIQPNRIDWGFTVIDEGPFISQVPSLGLFNSVGDSFFRPLESWLSNEQIPSIQRLAYGAVLLNPVEDLAAGYRNLSNYLPTVTIDPERSSDFLYQINRPRNSTIIPNLGINRLSKWSVTRMQIGLFSTAIGSQVSPVGMKTFYANRLELDINTNQDNTNPFDSENTVALFRELISLGSEIMTRGDI